MATPTILGSTSMTTSGWSKLFDYASGASSNTRIRLCAGPARSLDAAADELRSSIKLLSLEPSVSAGSAVATIRVEYTTASGLSLSAGETRLPTYQISHLMEVVALAAHPKAKSITPHIAQIEAFIAAGDISGLKDFLKTLSGNTQTSATYFARLLLAGVTSYEKPALQLSCTRYFSSPPSLSSEFQNTNKIFSWASISTAGQSIPTWVKEPYWRDAAGTICRYQWRLIEITPTLQRKGENVVTWTYVGRDAYAKELYSGGSWEPEPLTIT